MGNLILIIVSMLFFDKVFKFYKEMKNRLFYIYQNYNQILSLDSISKKD